MLRYHSHSEAIDRNLRFGLSSLAVSMAIHFLLIIGNVFQSSTQLAALPPAGKPVTGFHYPESYSDDRDQHRGQHFCPAELSVTCTDTTQPDGFDQLNDAFTCPPRHYRKLARRNRHRDRQDDVPEHAEMPRLP